MNNQTRFAIVVVSVLGVLSILFGLMGGCGAYVGLTGPAGPQGPNGHSAMFSQMAADSTACSNGGVVLSMGVDTNDSGSLETTEITNVAIVCNGVNGQSPELPNFTPVAVIMPCGAGSSPYKEVLLGLLGGGVLSEFTGSASDAATVRNTLVPDGSYYDTDNSQCNFSVSTDSHGNRTVSWDGSTHNGTGPFHAGHATYNSTSLTWTVVY